MSSRTAEQASLPLRICAPSNWPRECHTALTTDVLAEYMVQNPAPGLIGGIAFVAVSEQTPQTIEASHLWTAPYKGSRVSTKPFKSLIGAVLGLTRSGDHLSSIPHVFEGFGAHCGTAFRSLGADDGSRTRMAEAEGF
jgi:hypothetical protein